MSFDHLLHACRKNAVEEDEVLAEFCKMEDYRTRNLAEILEEK